MKTNSGKIYEVIYQIEGDNNKTITADGEEQAYYSVNVYATCEEHAKQIFDEAYKDEKIASCTIEETEDCISQHYDELSVSNPQLAMAEKLCLSMFDILLNDDKVEAEDLLAVIDIAAELTKKNIRRMIRNYNQRKSSDGKIY